MRIVLILICTLLTISVSAGIPEKREELKTKAKELIEQRGELSKEIESINVQLLQIKGSLDTLNELEAEKQEVGE